MRNTTPRLLTSCALLLALLQATAACGKSCDEPCEDFNIISACIGSGRCTLDGEEVSCPSTAGDDCPLLDIRPGQTLGFDLKVRNRANDLWINIPYPHGAEDTASDMRNAALLFDGSVRECERERFEIRCANLPEEEVAVRFRLEDGSRSTILYINLEDAECIASRDFCGL